MMIANFPLARRRGAPSARRIAGAALAAGWLAATLPVQAQTAGAKPADAKPAAGTRALQGGSGSGPLLTRDELRACLQQEADIRKRLEAHEGARQALDKEKEGIVADQNAMRSERKDIETPTPEIADLNARVKALSDRITRWNERGKAFQEKPPPDATAAEEERKALNAEREAMEKDRAALDVERNAVKNKRQGQVDAFNVKVAALDSRSADWNQRNAKWNEASAGLEKERLAWVSACADRRYREDDEAAIKRGR